MGDNFINISQAIIHNRSLVAGSIAKLSVAGANDEAEILKQIARVVEGSGNQEALELFSQFNEELQKPAPQKSLLRKSWENLQSVLPAVTAIAGAAAAVAKLFS